MKHFTLLGMALLMCGGAAAAQPRSASAPQLLLTTPTGLMAPVWSPDGSKIAVTGDNYTGIMVANADGTGLRTVTATAGAGYKMLWDGNENVVGRTNITENGRVMHELRAWNVADGASKVIVAKSRNAQAPSMRAIGRKRGAAGIYDQMVAQPAEVAAKVPALAEFAGQIIINPALSPDGSRIAFQVPGHGMWVMNADGTGLRSLGLGSNPSWLPDNESIVYTVVKDNGQVYTSSTMLAMNVVSGESVTLTSRTDMIPLTPAVSPDGTKVAFQNAADQSIYVVTLKY